MINSRLNTLGPVIPEPLSHPKQPHLSTEVHSPPKSAGQLAPVSLCLGHGGPQASCRKTHKAWASSHPLGLVLIGSRAFPPSNVFLHDPSSSLFFGSGEGHQPLLGRFPTTGSFQWIPGPTVHCVGLILFSSKQPTTVYSHHLPNPFINLT